MKSATKSLWIILFATLLPTVVVAKPRFIDLEKELLGAKTIAWAKIVGYGDSTVNAMTQGGDTIKASLFVHRGVRGPKPTDIWTMYQPAPGDSVLIVINQKGELSLCAFKQEKYYRFWSPHNSGSVAFFSFKEPAIRLPTEPMRQGDRPNECWDGCLYPINSLAQFVNSSWFETVLQQKAWYVCEDPALAKPNRQFTFLNPSPDCYLQEMDTENNGYYSTKWEFEQDAVLKETKTMGAKVLADAPTARHKWGYSHEPKTLSVSYENGMYQLFEVIKWSNSRLDLKLVKLER